MRLFSSGNPFRTLRWKRNRALIAAYIAGFTVLLVAFGSMRVTAITSSERHAVADDVSVDIQGLEDVFDDSVVHEISVTFDQADYERMIATYQSEGSKEYIEASITIDGTIINSVGLRLKGNSTLMSLRQDDNTQVQTQPQTDTDMDTDMDTDADTDTDTTTPEQQQQGQGMQRQAGGVAGFGSSTLSFDDPSSLPWLISFDEYVAGQRYQGLEEIAVRPMTGSESMLNEALALSLVGSAGEATQQASYTAFAVNGADATLRLLVEVPNASYAADNFDSDGVLYKAQATGQFAYLGEDPLAYADAFEQITRENQQDLAPLIELLRWVDESSDAEFDADLASYVDVESFARYIALQELLSNFDDMSGPGQNYYLWYDLDSGTFSVLTWDLNLAFGQGIGGGGAGGGAFPGGGGGQFPGGGDGTFPGGGTVPEGMTPPDGFTPPGGTTDGTQPTLPDGQGQFQRGGGGGGGAGGVGGGNLLKERFLASDAYAAVYAQAYADVYAALYGDGGAATAALERLQSVLASTDLIDADTLATEVASLQATIDTLTAAGPDAATTTTQDAPTTGDDTTAPNAPTTGDDTTTPDTPATGDDTTTPNAPPTDGGTTPRNMPTGPNAPTLTTPTPTP